MRNLIVSDILRILKKKTYWIIMGIVFVLSLTSMFSSNKSGFTSMVSQRANIQNTGSIILGICIFLSVYADEFSSRSMQCIIGRGLSRSKLQIAKFLDCVLLTLNSYCLWALWVFILNLIFRTNMQPLEMTALYAAFFTSAIQAIGYATISAIFLYKSSNVAAATVVDILFYIVLYTFLNLTATSAPLAPIIAVNRSCFTGRINQIYTGIVLGQDCGGLIVGTVITFIIGALVISVLVFRKRELEF